MHTVAEILLQSQQWLAVIQEERLTDSKIHVESVLVLKMLIWVLKPILSFLNDAKYRRLLSCHIETTRRVDSPVYSSRNDRYSCCNNGVSSRSRCTVVSHFKHRIRFLHTLSVRMRAAYKGFTLHYYSTDVMAESAHFSQCEEGSRIRSVSSLIRLSLKYSGKPSWSSTKGLSFNSLVTVSRWRSCVSEGQRRKLNETFRYLHLHPRLTACGGSTKSPFSVIIYNLSSYSSSDERFTSFPSGCNVVDTVQNSEISWKHTFWCYRLQKQSNKFCCKFAQ